MGRIFVELNIKALWAIEATAITIHNVHHVGDWNKKFILFNFLLFLFFLLIYRNQVFSTICLTSPIHDPDFQQIPKACSMGRGWYCWLIVCINPSSLGGMYTYAMAAVDKVAGGILHHQLVGRSPFFPDNSAIISMVKLLSNSTKSEVKPFNFFLIVSKYKL